MKEKIKRDKKLSRRIIAGIILLGAVLCFATSWIGYRQFTHVLELRYNDSAFETAETARSYLNADKLDTWLKTGEKDAEYLATERMLDELTETMQVTCIYVIKLDPSDYMTATYIFDSVSKASGFSRYPLGYTATDMDPQYAENIRIIMTTGQRVTEHCYSYSKESGAHTTAAAAVYNSDGEIIALVGVEKAMTYLVQARTDYVKSVLIQAIIFTALFVLIYFWQLNKSVVQPIVAIARESKRFAENDIQPSDALLAIKSKTEIGGLAMSIHKMELEISEYMANLAAVTAEKERISTELAVATEIQASMLPCIFPAFPDREEFEVYATMDPAKEVGGDFYDFFMVDDRHIAIVMADVSGKGVPAALFMVIGKTLLKDHTQPGLSLSEVFEGVNDLLCEANKEGLFITAFEGVLDLVTGEFRFANAGHEPPFIRGANGTYQPYTMRPGFVLAGMEGMKYKEGSFTLEPGSCLFQYTDGVTEATNAQNELYGMERLTKVLNANKDATPTDLLPAVRADIDLFVGDAPQFDDITMLCLEFRKKMEP